MIVGEDCKGRREGRGRLGEDGRREDGKEKERMNKIRRIGRV